MWKWLDNRAEEIDEATPEDRNRFADLLRVGAIAMVVLGHWLAPQITPEDGVFRLRLVHAVVDWTQWLTWLFQVMPIFFFVGGMVNAISWESAREDEQTYVDWLRKRARRLCVPLVPLLAVWVPLALVLDAAGVETYLVVQASHAMLFPIWFLAAYLGVVALAPLAHRLHRRWNAAALVMLVAAALVVDMSVRAGVEWMAWLNFLFVWGAIHQLGFFWRDRRMPKRARSGLAVAALSIGVLLALVYVFDYPATMVGTGFEEHPNDLPPSIALVVLAMAQIGVLFALRPWLKKWLERPRPWAVVTTVGGRIMTIYLWHMTALVVLALALYPTGIFPTPEQVDAYWWLLRIPWVLMLIVVLGAIVAAFGRFEEVGVASETSRTGRSEQLRAIVAVALTAVGVALLMTGGLYDGGGIVGVAWVPMGVLALGLWGLGVFDRSG